MVSSAVQHFQANRSVPRLLLRISFKGGLAQLKDVATMPTAANVARIRAADGISAWVIVLNVAAIALWTTGVFGSLYAGYRNSALRVTSSTLSAVVNGAATILMFVFIDPQMSVMTDDVIEGRTSEPQFRWAVVRLVGSRLAGTLASGQPNANRLEKPGFWHHRW